MFSYRNLSYTLKKFVNFGLMAQFSTRYFDDADQKSINNKKYK